jgi:hypothetical protein
MHQRIDNAVPTPLLLNNGHLVEEIFRRDYSLQARLAGRRDRHPWLFRCTTDAAERRHRRIRRMSRERKRSIRHAVLISGIRGVHLIGIKPAKRRIRQMADQTHLIQRYRGHAGHPDER